LPLDERPETHRRGHHHYARPSQPVEPQTIGDQEQGANQLTRRLKTL
jgi:hypothetical protein